MQQELDKGDQELNFQDPLDTKVTFYDEANKSVAILCNHQKTVSKSYEASKEKALQRIEDIDSYYNELKEHLALLKKGKKGYESDAETEKGKVARKFPQTIDKTKSLVEKFQDKIVKERFKLNDREDKKGIALGTSKNNYNDPRITVAWCKKNEMPIERVFSKDLRNKFIWAMDTEPLWKF